MRAFVADGTAQGPFLFAPMRDIWLMGADCIVSNAISKQESCTVSGGPRRGPFEGERSGPAKRKFDLRPTRAFTQTHIVQTSRCAVPLTAKCLPTNVKIAYACRPMGLEALDDSSRFPGISILRARRRWGLRRGARGAKGCSTCSLLFLDRGPGRPRTDRNMDWGATGVRVASRTTKTSNRLVQRGTRWPATNPQRGCGAPRFVARIPGRTQRKKKKNAPEAKAPR